MHIKRISLSLLALLSIQLYGHISLNDCGKGYDSITGICKKKPDNSIQCQTTTLSPRLYQKWQRIKNYSDLIKLVEIPYDLQLFQRSMVQKLLDNPHINPYTVTIAFFERFDIFNHTLKEKPTLPRTLPFDIYGDSYVTQVISGGAHLILYHIVTKSDKAYQTILKKINKAIHNGTQIYSLLTNINKTHLVIVKEHFSHGIDAVTTQDFAESFNHSDYFQQKVKASALPYKRIVRYYPTQKRGEAASIKKRVASDLNHILAYAYQYNAYRFYRHHSEDFFPLTTKQKRELVAKAELLHRIVGKSFKTLSSMEQNLSATRLEIPRRFQTSIPENSQLIIPPQSIRLKIKNFNQIPYPPKKYRLRLTAQLDIQNGGKILRIIQNITLMDQNGTYNISNKQILFDTYVDFPGLRFKDLEMSYASATTTLLFDKYDKTFTIKGEGLIDTAECRYKLAHKILDIACNRIIYKKLKVNFLHEELMR